MPRRARSIDRRLPLATAALYAAGLVLATWTLAVAAQVLNPTLPWRALSSDHRGGLPVLVLLAALVGAGGFALGWRVLGPRRPSLPRAAAAALAAGCAFPWFSGLLLPLLAAGRAGVWPLLAWCMLGSALMVLPVARVAQRTRKGNS